MTLDEKAEKYDLARNTVLYRQKHGIPLDAPKRPANLNPKAHPKGYVPKRKCLHCSHLHPIRCKACPECGQPVPPKGTKP